MGMLLLTRKEEQWIEVGDGAGTVRVKVIKIRPDGGVMLGIQAPRELNIRRGPEHRGTSDPGTRGQDGSGPDRDGVSAEGGGGGDGDTG